MSANPRTACQWLEGSITEAIVAVKTANPGGGQVIGAVDQTLNGISEAPTRSIAAKLRTVPQTLGGMSEAVVRAASARTRTVAQTLAGMVEQPTRTLAAKIRTVAQTLNAISEAPTRTIAAKLRTIPQTLGSIGEAVVGSKVVGTNFVVACGDTLQQIYDYLWTEGWPYVRTAADTVGAISESAVRSAYEYAKTVADTLGALTEAVTVPGQAFIRAIAEGFGGAFDDFDRYVEYPLGWGTATCGLDWDWYDNLSGTYNSGAVTEVGGGVYNGNAWAVLGGPVTDTTVVSEITLYNAISGDCDWLEISNVHRARTAANPGLCYRIGIVIFEGATTVAQVRAIYVNDLETVLLDEIEYFEFPVEAGGHYWLKTRLEGNAPRLLKLKIWQYGGVEPTDWMQTWTDEDDEYTDGGGCDVGYCGVAVNTLQGGPLPAGLVVAWQSFNFAGGGSFIEAITRAASARIRTIPDTLGSLSEVATRIANKARSVAEAVSGARYGIALYGEGIYGGQFGHVITRLYGAVKAVVDVLGAITETAPRIVRALGSVVPGTSTIHTTTLSTTTMSTTTSTTSTATESAYLHIWDEKASTGTTETKSSVTLTERP